jgi:hypothetical protein
MNDELKFMSMAEIEARADAKWNEWLKTRRIGCAEYDPEDNVIVLYVYPGNSTYEVDLDRCQTSAELADWIFHLAAKTWCKGSVMMDFIQCLKNAIEERHGKNPFAYFKTHG